MFANTVPLYSLFGKNEGFLFSNEVADRANAGNIEPGLIRNTKIYKRFYA